MRVLAVDDEKYMLESIVNVLEQCGADIAAAFTKPAEALEWFKKNHSDVDAAFLDISMPVLNGFALADALLNINENLPVVFVTAYDSYAVKAFEQAALDYVLKPAHVERIAQTLERIDKKTTGKNLLLNNNAESVKLQDLDKDLLWEKKRMRSALLKLMSGREHCNDVLLFRNGTWQWIDKKLVCSFSRDKTEKYVQVLVGNLYYETVDSMNEFQENFAAREWVTCFRAVNVCLSHVLRLEKGSGGDSAFLVLKDSGKTLPVSRGYLDEVAMRLHEFL